MTLFKDVFVVSGCGVGGGSLGYANTLYRPTPGSAFYRDPQWAGLEDWESALAPHYDTAERMLGVTQYEGEGPADRMLREIASEMGVEDTLLDDPRRRVLRRARPHGARSLLRRRGAAARGLHPLRRVHGRLPPQREEHARQELPLVRRARRRRDPARAHRRRHPPARCARRLRRLRGHERALGRVGAQGPPHADRPRRRRRGRRRSGPTSCCSAAGSGARCRGSPSASATSCAPTPRRSRPSPPRTSSTTSRSRSRSPRASIPIPTRTSRTSPTARARTRSRCCSRSCGPRARGSRARCGRGAGRGGR